MRVCSCMVVLDPVHVCHGSMELDPAHVCHGSMELRGIRQAWENFRDFKDVFQTRGLGFRV